MKDIDLKIQISARSDALLGKYIAHNLSSQPAFLFDILHGEASNSGSFELFESRVYVEIGQNRVTLSRKIMPVPPSGQHAVNPGVGSKAGVAEGQVTKSN